MSSISASLRLTLLIGIADSLCGSVLPAPESACTLSSSLLNSINVQLLRPPEMSSNQTRLFVQEELLNIFTALGSGDVERAMLLDKSELVSLLSSFSSAMYHYSESFEVPSEGLNVLGQRHLSNLAIEELHTLWFSVQNVNPRQLVVSILNLVRRANDFVFLHLHALEANEPIEDIPRDEEVRFLPLFLFPRYARIRVLGHSPLLVEFLNQTNWFSLDPSQPEYIVCVEECIDKLNTTSRIVLRTSTNLASFIVDKDKSKQLQKFMKIDDLYYIS